MTSTLLSALQTFGLPRAANTRLSKSAIGLGLLALLISYLPTIYAAFSRRATLVTMLEPLAGSLPSAVTMLKRHHRVGALDRLDSYWRRYQELFADIEESHTSLAALVFLRLHHDREACWHSFNGWRVNYDTVLLHLAG